MIEDAGGLAMLDLLNSPELLAHGDAPQFARWSVAGRELLEQKLSLTQYGNNLINTIIDLRPLPSFQLLEGFDIFPIGVHVFDQLHFDGERDIRNMLDEIVSWEGYVDLSESDQDKIRAFQADLRKDIDNVIGFMNYELSQMFPA